MCGLGLWFHGPSPRARFLVWIGQINVDRWVEDLRPRFYAIEGVSESLISPIEKEADRPWRSSQRGGGTQARAATPLGTSPELAKQSLREEAVEDP
jgi:hypothetical protein